MGQREIERWETTNNTFKIRVIAHPEEGGFVAGAYYVLQSAGAGGQSVGADGVEWREIMIFFLIAIALPLTFSPQKSVGWRGIVPLYSTRADVERL